MYENNHLTDSQHLSISIPKVEGSVSYQKVEVYSQFVDSILPYLMPGSPIHVLQNAQKLLLSSLKSAPKAKATYLTSTSDYFSHNKTCPFGLLLDIDGVIVRGREILPGARESFKILTDSTGKFRVPTVFVTNAGNVLRATKAAKLSELLRVEIDPHQVLMSHSPLRMFTQFHDRHVLVVGQGPVMDISRGLGFKKVSTIDEIRKTFPNLDMVDHSYRTLTPSGFENYFPPIEAIILFGLPVKWECQLQLIVDLLMTDGKPTENRTKRHEFPYPHIPILACNIDLLWMSEACLPRFAHGTFMLCLEALYKKLTGHDLKYTALVGKPSELTYHHAEGCIRDLAQALGLPSPRTLYAIGDNPESDILGANLFHQYLRQRTLRKRETAAKLKHQQAAMQHQAAAPQHAHAVAAAGALAQFSTLATSTPAGGPGTRTEANPRSPEGSGHHDASWAEQALDFGVEQCFSVLVETGVYSKNFSGMNGIVGFRNFDPANDSILKTPSFTEPDLLSAVKMILEREGMSANGD